MYDMEPLEDEWKKYRKNKLKPLYMAITSLVLISIIVLGTFNIKKINLNSLKIFVGTDKIKEEKYNKIRKKVIVTNGALMQLEVEKKVITMANNESIKKVNILVDIPILDNIKQPINDSALYEKKTIDLNIIESSSISAYKDVEKRFLQSHDVNDALFLAKSYYKKGNYSKAEYWALETNKVDENVEESLLIFVKSKIKLGRKNEAIAILMSYVNKTDSMEAKNLLYQIKNDKF